jgi:hypothetical protein
MDRCESGEVKKLTIRRLVDEIMGGKEIVKMSDVKFFGGFLNFSSILCLSKYFGGQK